VRVTLGIRQLPKAPVARIAVQDVPSARIDAELNELIINEPLDSAGRDIGPHFPVLQLPPTDEVQFVCLQVHRTISTTARGGMGPFGTTNSRAPPLVRPPCRKPSFVRNTGEAIPPPPADAGNLMTVNVSAGRPKLIVGRCASCLALRPATSSAATALAASLRCSDLPVPRSLCVTQMRLQAPSLLQVALLALASPA
jgi:hypothetical protein